MDSNTKLRKQPVKYLSRMPRRAALAVTRGWVALAAAALPFAASAEPPRAGVPMAAILSLTGNAADQGEWARRGFEIARDELLQERHPVAMRYEDSKGGDVKTAVEAYRALLQSARPAVVFSYGSGVGLGLTPLVNKDGIVQIGIATASPAYRTVGDFTFRNFPSAAEETKFLTSKLRNDLGVKRFAVLHINNDYGVGTADAFKKAFTAIGGEVTEEASYNPAATDFRAELLVLKRSAPEAVYLASYPTDGALILKQASELGIKSRFFASVAIVGSAQFFDLAGDSAEGLTVVSSPVNEESAFAKVYSRKYPGESAAQMTYAARAYDALRLAANAATACGGPDASCIKETLAKTKDYSGASGSITFDEAGDIIPSFKLSRIQSRKFVPLSE